MEPSPSRSFSVRALPIEPGDLEKMQVFQGDALIAEIRGTDVETRTITPVRELDPSDEDSFYRFIDNPSSLTK
ncbi:hypothetical protein BEP19_15155 [Ammoniphilus oxalaticus]|uniref:Uncharacterized protein n=1 Tax=Ammoniphilus oxalaticus TaxID=66863 RepID=A0A419SD43_9BACL|nr:hypothetical protein BEP19_15155 [Ammoniphilus oxalaticus]